MKKFTKKDLSIKKLDSLDMTDMSNNLEQVRDYSPNAVYPIDSIHNTNCNCNETEDSCDDDETQVATCVACNGTDDCLDTYGCDTVSYDVLCCDETQQGDQCILLTQACADLVTEDLCALSDLDTCNCVAPATKVCEIYTDE